MRNKISHPVNIAVLVALALFIGHIAIIPAHAEEPLNVSIGKSATFAKKAVSHDITLDALKSGQSEFSVSSSADEAYPIRLSEKQIEDILAGSTVVLETEDGGKKVKIGPQKKKAKKSGW
jgi:hypothetical protein